MISDMVTSTSFIMLAGVEAPAVMPTYARPEYRQLVRGFDQQVWQ